MKLLLLGDFPLTTFDKVRYADTDRQGHVNNAVFATFLETGRVEILYDQTDPVLLENCSFVIVALKLDFVREIHWPGQAEIGTGIARIGNSSLTLYQQIFQKEACVARAETRIVQVSQKTGRSLPLSDHARNRLAKLLLAQETR